MNAPILESFSELRYRAERGNRLERAEVGAEVHHLCPLSIQTIDGDPGESAISTKAVDIRGYEL